MNLKNLFSSNKSNKAANPNASQNKKALHSAKNNALFLAGFAVLVTTAISFTYHLTKSKISEQARAASIKTLSSLVDANNYTNDIYLDCLLTNASKKGHSADSHKIYRLRNGDKNYGVLITSRTDEGYSGDIDIVTAIDRHGKIIGAETLKHSETPGLGDKIERRKSDWMMQFDQKFLSTNSKRWQLKKDKGEFDALTGATITSRAVLSNIYQTLVYFNRNKDMLFNAPSNCYDAIEERE